MNSDILVSISCITYNHSDYIRKAIDGFLMQKTDFCFEILIHDDCSTDGTAEIIKEYEKDYPDLIFPIYEQENQFSKGGPVGSAVWNVPRARGKYIALCEGDDYWIDPLKLQKQVDYMEDHPEIGLCYTDYNRLEEESRAITNSMFETQHKYRTTSYEQFLLKPGYLAPMTWLFRSTLEPLLLNANIYSDGTYAWMLEFMQNSQVGYLPIVTATYRSHAGSLSSPLGDKALWKYSKGVVDTQFHYIQKYPCSKELQQKIMMGGYLRLLPIAIMAEQNDYVEEARSYFASMDMDIDLIIRELKAGEARKKSYAYRVGKKIVAPFAWMRKNNRV
jgi:glycosyltransferase involved in cell wall biosynthesis